MHDTGCSGLVHGDDPEGWDGEEGGRGVQARDYSLFIFANLLSHEVPE